MDLGDKRNLYFNSRMLLEEIKETSAKEVLAKMKRSFKEDEWTEELKLQAISCYGIVTMSILTPCATLDVDMLDIFAEGIDNNKVLVNLMYPAIMEAFNDVTGES